jgi:hypothetical protein
MNRIEVDFGKNGIVQDSGGTSVTTKLTAAKAIGLSCKLLGFIKKEAIHHIITYLKL